MKEFVPEYKSQHSKFESIDKEIEQEGQSGGSLVPRQPNAE